MTEPNCMSWDVFDRDRAEIEAAVALLLADPKRRKRFQLGAVYEKHTNELLAEVLSTNFGPVVVYWTQVGAWANSKPQPSGAGVPLQAALLALATELDRTHPAAPTSLREGLDETLTVLRLGMPPTLARTLRSTNCIESMISVCREHAGNVKRWRDGQMALRWCAAGMVEAGKQFRRVNGHLHLPTLRTALERQTAQPVGPVVHNDKVSAA